MDTVDSVDLRAIEKLKRDMGRSLMEALEDPETLEIMLNPDGKLWREKFGQPMFCMGTVPVQRSKTIIQTIAGFHKKSIPTRHFLNVNSLLTVPVLLVNCRHWLQVQPLLFVRKPHVFSFWMNM